MRRKLTKLVLGRETIRTLTQRDLSAVAGGRQKTTSSDADGELCPTDWSYYCVP